MSNIDITRLQGLPLEERLRAMEALWDSIARDPAALEVPGWHRETLARRLAQYREQRGEGATWPEVRKLIEGERKSRP